MANKSTLIGASDRMLTAGDVEFEPDQYKIWQFSSAIVALVAGDYALQSEILKRVDIEIKRRINEDPKTWVSVKEVGTAYCKKYRDLLREHAEAEILSPLGLDINTFLKRQGRMRPELVESIAEKLTKFQFPSLLETIFIGTDNDGPLGDDGEKLTYAQIYATEGDKLASLTTVGFAAIGIGKPHAESQFMFSGHSPNRPFSDTMLLTYAAKKRAEVAPGVGKTTDMVVIGPGLGTLLKVEDAHLEKLDKIYQKSRVEASKAVERAKLETAKLLEAVRKEYAERAEKKENKKEGGEIPQLGHGDKGQQNETA
jgi:hypothetical protein